MLWLRALQRELRWIAATGLTLAVACGPSKKGSAGGGSTTPATAADLDATCESQCSRSDRCPDPDITSPPHEDCVSSCLGKLGDAGVFRQDVVAALSDCYDSLACNVSDDTCTGEAVAVVTTTPTEDPHFQQCVSRHDTCDSGGGGFSDDECVLRFFLVQSAQLDFDACLQQDCSTISACLDGLRGF
jgi:hypothetical protein